MKKILGLAVAALLVMGLVGGGTWAYFSDTETSAGNVLTAGTLDLETGSTTTVPMALEKLVPNTGQDYVITLSNVGDIDGTLSMTISTPVDTDVTTTEPETTDELDVDTNTYCDGSLDDDSVLVTDKDSISKFTQLSITYAGYSDSPDKLYTRAGTPIALGTLVAGASDVQLTMSFLLDPDATDITSNIFQGDDSTFTITFELVQ